jgi:glycosyltransferase involved in cell wall biosynthesis
MRVLHLSTTTSGGAGRAAVRSVDALKLLGIDAKLLSRDDAKEQLSEISKYRSIKFSAKSSTTTILQRLLLQNSNELITTLSTDLFQESQEILESIQDFNIIHLHASYNFFNPMTLMDKLGEIPIVMTLHDERLITGGCHYTTTCQGFMSNCSNCPKVSLLGKKLVKHTKVSMNNSIKSSGNRRIHLITPSNWLQNQIIGISEFAKVPNAQIYNCIPDSFFTESLIGHAQEQEFRVGMIATDIFSPYKGFEFFMKGISYLKKYYGMKLKVVLVTNKKMRNYLNSDVDVELAFPKDNEGYLQILDSLSVACVPSSSDNSPNVIAETLARGVVVVASNSGGAGEIPSALGLQTFKYGDLESFCESMILGLTRNRLTLEQQSSLKNMVSEETHAKKLLKIYKSMI